MSTEHLQKTWIRVTLCDQLRHSIWHELIDAAKQAELSLPDFLSMSRIQRQARFKTSEQFERALQIHPLNTRRIDQIYHDLKTHSISIVGISDETYPTIIKQYMGLHAPPVLFMRGTKRILHNRSLAMVGTREPSAQGHYSAYAYAQVLAQKKINIVSGMARGIDQAAHLGALSSDGPTTFVLASGILKANVPQEINEQLEDKQGLIVSPWPPDKKWESRYAIARNDIIVALSDGVFAVETGLRGGTSYAIRESLRTRKPLFTLNYPKDNTPESAAGNHSLLALHGIPLLPLIEDEGVPVKEVLAKIKTQHEKRKHEVVWPPQPDAHQEKLF